MKNHIIAIIVCAVGVIGQVSASPPAIPLTIKDGKLSGMPESYRPAEFDLKNKVLRINNLELRFTAFIKSLFSDDASKDKLQLSALRYDNDQTNGPASTYLLFKISPKDKDFKYIMLIDMDTLEVKKILVSTYRDKYLSDDFRVDPSSWKKEAIEAIRPIKSKNKK